MSDESGSELERLLKARRAVIHGLANSLAILGNNLPSLRVHVHQPDGVALMVDTGADLDRAREVFQELYGETIRRAQVNRLATSLTVVFDNLQELARHTTDEEGKLILGQMQIAAERARKQFAALRKLL